MSAHSDLPGSGTATDFATLERLAREATPGTWAGLNGHVYDDATHNCVAVTRVQIPPFGIDLEQQWGNAHYIAACSPDATLSLLAALRVAEQQRGTAVKDFAMHLIDYGSVIQREKLPSIMHAYLASRSPQSETAPRAEPV